MLAGGATEDAQRVEQLLEQAGCHEASSRRQTLEAVVLGFIDTMNWDHACHYITIHPEMLDPKAAELLASLAPGTMRISELPVTNELVATHGQFLQECREYGLDAVRYRRVIKKRALTNRHIEAIIMNTHTVLTSDPERKAEWLTKLAGIVEDALRQDDSDTAAFVKAVIAVVDRGIGVVSSVESSVPQSYSDVWEGLIKILRDFP
jgi:hypothetical protein